MGDRVILHSDINCCYASIEHLHHPELAGKPLAVGGDPETRHGIVLTADYIAKKYGVKTGMALWQAKQVCPDITFVSPRMDLYLRFSRMAHEIYAEYTDRQEPYGIDECWLDVTGSSSLKGDGLLIAQEISRRMKSELGITVSVRWWMRYAEDLDFTVSRGDSCTGTGFCRQSMQKKNTQYIHIGTFQVSNE